jgi:hypothetical protein
MKWLKIIGSLLMISALILIYSVAITQTSKNANPGSRNNSNTAIDTTDLGQPTDDDPYDQLSKLLKAYYEKDGISYKGSMKLFDGNGDEDKLLEEKNFEYSYFNNEYSYSLSPIEVVDKKDYSIIVNHDDKVIAVAPKIGKQQRADLFNLKDFKKILEQQKANVKVTQLGDEKMLTIDSIQDPNIQGYRIYYSPTSYKIRKILIGMLRLNSLDEEPEEDANKLQAGDKSVKPEDQEGVDVYYYYLEINYSEIKALSLHEGEFNPEKKFLKTVGKKIELTDAFEGYQFFNSEE